MERVETLLIKLQEQYNNQTSPEHMLLTVQMLQAELMQLQGRQNVAVNGTNIAVTVFQNTVDQNCVSEITKMAFSENEKTLEILELDESEVEAELEEIKRNAEEMLKISQLQKPKQIFADPEEFDIPTLAHQEKAENINKGREINESIHTNSGSLNEKLRQTSIDLGDTLTEAPIRDLRKAIGVNDRYLFISELFRGDEITYERSIKTINGFSIFAEAEYWIQRELKVKNSWDDQNPMVRQFYALVRRRFV